ncbi:hypothetical protein L13192_07210 [Pyrenophora tritici-repentis]|uniref:DUF7730 domain-containing protein n=1 Tax=Pyrenophora tritici-repentis TaxID=45151 RepID=A0A922N2E3_9PLEO|nr:hypothetical protein Ptr86124_012514 [Pyrenophora tritici-repentis]KAI1668074.1 hypothetical protein L13192_07210 [Pyrenophora tritici-repentis]KAI1681211.1 hypothetical protein KJE20_10062 [Pyrenophora tritici-repentis]
MMQIPKADSVPMDAEEASFLTTLPAEMRSSIYELLFKKDKPILLHNAAAFHPEEPSQLQWPHTDDAYSQNMREYWESYEEDAGLDEEFRHNFGDGLALLSSCRQLYHEASGVLYGHNSFIISRAVIRHDETDTYDTSIYEHQEYLPPIHAAHCLSNLGSQAELLRKVIIDTDTLCPVKCDYSSEVYNILPLVRFLWHNPSMKDVVTCGQSGRIVDRYRLMHTGPQKKRHLALFAQTYSITYLRHLWRGTPSTFEDSTSPTGFYSLLKSPTLEHEAS